MNALLWGQENEAMFGWFGRKGRGEEALSGGLKRTRESLLGKLARTLGLAKSREEDFYDELEEVLVTSDVGVETTLRIIDGMRERLAGGGGRSEAELHDTLRTVIKGLVTHEERGDLEASIASRSPYVILVVGVNGVGKTTTIGKLAHRYKSAGLRVHLAAADTFRAAAVEQLSIWAERVEVGITRQAMGADPASVAYEGIQAARAAGADVLLIDTAGRLHNKVNLMAELGKIKRVLGKVDDTAPHEVMLVLDGSTGQNAFEQARQFSLVTQVTGLTLTKLDGTAKGGVVLGICHELGVPIRYIGVGEGVEDLLPFEADRFVDSLLS